MGRGGKVRNAFQSRIGLMNSSLLVKQAIYIKQARSHAGYRYWVHDSIKNLTSRRTNKIINAKRFNSYAAIIISGTIRVRIYSIYTGLLNCSGYICSRMILYHVVDYMIM